MTAFGKMPHGAHVPRLLWTCGLEPLTSPHPLQVCQEPDLQQGGLGASQ